MHRRGNGLAIPMMSCGTWVTTATTTTTCRCTWLLRWLFSINDDVVSADWMQA
jgi:hypothetical protein